MSITRWNRAISIWIKSTPKIPLPHQVAVRIGIPRIRDWRRSTAPRAKQTRIKADSQACLPIATEEQAHKRRKQLLSRTQQLKAETVGEVATNSICSFWSRRCRACLLLQPGARSKPFCRVTLLDLSRPRQVRSICKIVNFQSRTLFWSNFCLRRSASSSLQLCATSTATTSFRSCFRIALSNSDYKFCTWSRMTSLRSVVTSKARTPSKPFWITWPLRKKKIS